MKLWKRKESDKAIAIGTLRFLFVIVFLVFSSAQTQAEAETETISEIWMGIYMNGVKIGYSFSSESRFTKDGRTYTRSIQESLMRVTRLGGNPVEIATRQSALFDASENPLETVLTTKLSASETVIKAEVKPGKIVFRSGDRITKVLPYTDKFYLGVPLDEIVKKDGLIPGKKYTFKMLEPLTQSFVDVSFNVIGKEPLLILGEKRELWHVRSEMTQMMPIVMDEWIDEQGEVWKSVSQASFLNTVSIRMPKDLAMELSDENLDIAFSVLIESNVRFPAPQQVQSVTFKVSGIPISRLESFPFDGETMTLKSKREDHAVIQTHSLIFSEEKAINLPIRKAEFLKYLEPTTFCQADDSDIVEVARSIVGDETNSWAAAKRIAQWVNREMSPNYDVGFASAREIMRNREGDCTEHTVIMVTLCRAVGIPARAAVGVMYGDGIFAYHMWPEVYAGRWVGIDPKWLSIDKKTGEYYTDATHVKFGDSVLDEGIFEEMGQAMAEIIGKLNLEVLEFSVDKGSSQKQTSDSMLEDKSDGLSTLSPEF